MGESGLSGEGHSRGDRFPAIPFDDGWGWLYRSYLRLSARAPALGRLIRGYLYPTRLELKAQSRLYRILGVGWFGRLIPTGGIWVRRFFRVRMRPYTLAASTVEGARRFFYRTCAFEAAHLPFFLILMGLTLHRLAVGRTDLAVEDFLVNLVANIYPILHHRHTRARIVRLLRRSERGGARAT